MEAEGRGFVSPFWLTFNQAKQFGAFVRKGEHGSPVVYAARFTKTEKADNGDEIEREIPFLKEYTVFNADQVEGLPPHFYAMAKPQAEPVKPIETARQFFANTQFEIRVGGNRAYYTVEGDYIQMPPIEAFRDAESHVATLAHESIHATRHPSRLNRDFGRKRWGDEGYSMEELTAELGAAYLCADLQITPEIREDHASYICHWIKILKNDTRAIFSAASYASKAVDYLHGLQPEPASA
jgi:antirestriction protein ArdC